jgi:hypothetical protein
MRTFRAVLLSTVVTALLLASVVTTAGAAPSRPHHPVMRLAPAVAVSPPDRSARPEITDRGASRPDLLFYGDKISEYGMNQSAPGAVSEVTDPDGNGGSVFKMTVANDDVAPVTPTSDPRAQLLSPSIIEPGEEFWWSGRFFLPPDFPSSVPGWLTVMEGPYGAPFDGTPPWHIEINGESIQWTRNDTYGYDIPWQMPLVRGQWVDVVVHELFSEDGWVEMWVDGQQITFFDSDTYNPLEEPATSRLQMQTRDHSNDGGPNFTVIQSYRQAGILPTVSLLQGPMAIGTSKNAVE